MKNLHNGWLETILTYGVPEVLLLLKGSTPPLSLGRMAVVLTAFMAIASVSDYLLRPPAIGSVEALINVIFSHDLREGYLAGLNEGRKHS
jgi:hypothetical protein